MKLDPISTFLYWRMNWHTEHHMYAGVPCYNLRRSWRARLAADMPEPRTLVGAWREMLEIWNRQVDDPDYQYDTPLPPTAGSIAHDEQDSDERRARATWRARSASWLPPDCVSR